MVKPEILMQDRLEGKTGKQSKQAGRQGEQPAGREGRPHGQQATIQPPLKGPSCLRAIAILHYVTTS